MAPGYGKIKQAAAYMNISVRTLRSLLQEGLPSYKLPTGCILLKYSDIDAFINQFKVENNFLDELTTDIATEVLGRKK